MKTIDNPTQLPEYFFLLRSVEAAEPVKEYLSEFYRFGDVYVFEKGKYKIIALEVLNGVQEDDEVPAQAETV